ncbi:MAG: SpoIIE family protein phosphatase [Bacteroidales bacterium]|nr:SpoIIE family protein phosphatase [Bacteroidales bacterium]
MKIYYRCLLLSNPNIRINNYTNKDTSLLFFSTVEGIYTYNKETNTFAPDSFFNPLLASKKHPTMSFSQDSDGNAFFDGNSKFILEENNTFLMDTLAYKRVFQSYYSTKYDELSQKEWFCGINILISCDVNHKRDYNQKYSPLIRKVILGSDSVIFNGTFYKIDPESNEYYPIKNQQEHQKPNIDYDNNSMTISFATPYFEKTDDIEHSFKLENFDKKWSEWSNKNTKEYTNLPEGKYTFKVKAKNIYGVESEIATYEFKILPPWHRTWWAYSMYFILLALFIFVIVKLSLRRVIKQKNKLEEIVKDRTSEILEKNEELFQQKEEIQAQAEELEVTNQELEKLSIVASETDNAVLIFDEKFNLTWANNAFSKIYGYTLGEFISANINLIENSNSPVIKNIINSCIEEKKSVTYKAENKKKSGESIWVQTTITPIFEFNKLSKIIAIESDITEIKKANEKITKANIEITKANKEISYQHNQIKLSINSALTIQQAILPLKENIDNHLNNFIIYRPKDVVSGDFYWFTIEQDSISFFAVVDCTGHGVPGAFMSMIGNSLLNEIIKQRQIYDPKEILTQLDFEINKSLKQDITENQDGMDVCLCKIEKTVDAEMKIVFTGAKRPLFYYKSNEQELNKLKGDRKSIGGKVLYNKTKFTNQEIFLYKNDLIYLTTDGYVDQNNKERERFGTTRFERIINQIAIKPLSEQQQILETELDKWQGDEKQRDDITVIGVQL